MLDLKGLDIHPSHLKIVLDILRRYLPQYEIWAFGSRVKSTAKPYSDLDLAVISEHPLPLMTSVHLSEAFSESDLPWKVDVVDWATTSAAFRSIIECERIVLQLAGGLSSPEGAPPTCE